MNIAILGYGKMGKLIEQVALNAGHNIVLRIQSHNVQDLALLSKADVAIDFSRPQAAVTNLMACKEAGIPVVCGTTGWLQEWENVTYAFKMAKGTFFYASNFSLGVNIFFALNRNLAQMMQKYSHIYTPSVKEIHHIHKLDAPSGTGLTIANDIIRTLPNLEGWALTQENDNIDTTNTLPIDAQRIGEVIGTHIVHYTSAIDTLKIEHEAHNRQGFAAGAVAAAEWLVQQQPGIYNMNDFLALEK